MVNPALFAAVISATVNSNRKRNGEMPDVPHLENKAPSDCFEWGCLALVLLFVIAIFAICSLTGCSTTEKLADGIATKNISGNGTFFKSAIGINPDTKIPEISSTIVNGDYASAKSGTNSILYRSERTGSIWNASVTTEKKFVSITLENGSDVGDVIRAVSDVLRAAGGEPNEEIPAAEAAEP